MRKIIFVCFLFCLLSSTLVSQEKKSPIPQERVSVQNAIKTYNREVEEARQAYEAAIEKAGKKLISTYDSSIKTAMNRGGSEALDLANRLTAEKKEWMEEIPKTAENNPVSPKEKVIDQIVNRKWYWFWEQQNRDNPHTFRRDGKVITNTGEVPKAPWSIESRWVIRWNGHFLLLVDDDLMRGFHDSGRGVGAFADPKKKK
jgi:hypothetical protein